jgi:uncharacterized protein YecT (DUF1311 family)
MLMRNIVTSVICLILIVLPSAALHAQTQQEMTAAEGEKFKQDDKALNAAYDRLLAKISPAGQSALREAQRTWLRFRDQECDFEAFGSKGGSVNSMAVLICMARMTRTRTAELAAQIECEEGDVTCGHQ